MPATDGDACCVAKWCSSHCCVARAQRAELRLHEQWPFGWVYVGPSCSYPYVSNLVPDAVRPTCRQRRAARGIVRRILRGSQAPDLGVDGSINNDTDKRCGTLRELSSMRSRFAWDVKAVSSMLNHVRLFTCICFVDLGTKCVRRSVRCSCYQYLHAPLLYRQMHTRTLASGRKNQK